MDDCHLIGYINAFFFLFFNKKHQCLAKTQDGVARVVIDHCIFCIENYDPSLGLVILNSRAIYYYVGTWALRGVTPLAQGVPQIRALGSCLGKDIVFRFIIEYTSSLRDLL
jgi:hypothetical protein